jgi:hypothetical protein
MLMASYAELASAKEHLDIIVTLLLSSLGALMSCVLYIFHQMNKTAADTILVVERHTKEIANLHTCVSKICTAHNINHNQDLEC